MAHTPTGVGVIVGRFHIHEPHYGHRAFIQHVMSRHPKVLIALGVTAGLPSDHDPLPYEVRRVMMLKEFPEAEVVALEDVRDDSTWSRRLDALIEHHYPNEHVTLYGSRDSFIGSYRGKYETAYVPESSRRSGTSVRERIKTRPSIGAAFRRGIIYALMNRPPITYPTVDVGVYRNQGDTVEVLLGRKPHDPQGKYRFIGGFVDPADTSYEVTAGRERREESGHYETGSFEYVGSHRVDDWRYRGRRDGIMTILFRAQHIFGYIEAGDDIEEVAWFKLESMMSILVEEHLPLGEKYLASFNKDPLRTNINA